MTNKNTCQKLNLLLLLISFSAFSWPRGPNYNDIRAMGMGNSTVAVTTDRTAIFHNPAGLSLIKEKIDVSLSPIVLGIDGKLITILKTMASQGDKMSNLSNIDNEFIDELNVIDGEWVGLQYIPEFTVAKKNLGFGFYSTWPLGVRVETGHFIPKLALRGQRDMVFTWAVGVPLKNKNHNFGISVEYLQRTPVDERIMKYSDTFLLFDDLQQRPLGVLGDYGEIEHGASFDIGFMHNMSGFRIAWDIKDIFGVVGGDIVFPPQFDLGCAYFFPQLEKVKAIRNCIITAEIHDFLKLEERTNRFEQFGKKVHFGFEFDMKYAAIRGGFNQGYPTFGFGLELGMINIDYAYFTEETGYFAGQRPKNMHVLSFRFGLRIDDSGDYSTGEESESAISEEEKIEE